MSQSESLSQSVPAAADNSTLPQFTVREIGLIEILKIKRKLELKEAYLLLQQLAKIVDEASASDAPFHIQLEDVVVEILEPRENPFPDADPSAVVSALLSGSTPFLVRLKREHSTLPSISADPDVTTKGYATTAFATLIYTLLTGEHRVGGDKLASLRFRPIPSQSAVLNQLIRNAMSGDFCGLSCTAFWDTMRNLESEPFTAFNTSAHASIPRPAESLLADSISECTAAADSKTKIVRRAGSNTANNPVILSRPRQAGLPKADTFIYRDRAFHGPIIHEVDAHTPQPQISASPTPDEPPAASPSSHYPPENVQFTLFRPRSITREKWRKMLVYAHLDDGPPDQPTPLERVREEVAHLLRHETKDYVDVTKDSRSLIPREAEIQFVPHAAGVRFNPPVRTFFWTEGTDIHREEFEVRATAEALPGEVSGTLTVYVGVLIVSELPMRFKVVSQTQQEPAAADNATAHAKPYRNIFPSYSRRDDPVVQQLEAYASTLGDSYLKDVTTLRAGEEWSPRLLQLIERADVFQLFWSPRSAQSKEVEKEWRHALLQRKPNFIRPTYWEVPMPTPPSEMGHLHFQRLVIPPASPTSNNRDFQPTQPPDISSPSFEREPHPFDGPYDSGQSATTTDSPLPPSRTSSEPHFSKTGFGAMGNVEVIHAPTHHEDNLQSSQNYHPAPSSCSSSADFSRPKSGRLIPLITASLTIITVFIMGGLWMQSGFQEPRISMPPSMPEPSNPDADLPTIEVAELGSLAGGSFIPHSTFKSGDLLTLRLRVSRGCYLRVLYQSANGTIMLISPQTKDASQRIKCDTDVYVPDFGATLSKDPEYVLQLYHDTGVGPPLRESIFIQVSDEPFSFEGTKKIPNLRFPILVDTSVKLALTLGVRAVIGLSIEEAEKKMHRIVNQRRLDLTVAP